MTDSPQDLATVSLFKALAPAELATVSELTKTVEWQAGGEIYATGDPGGSMFAVLTGAVEIFGIVSGVEKLFMTVRDGGVFGLLSILDQGDRPGNARALETTKALVLERAGLDQLLADQPEVGAKVLEGLSRTLGQRVRLLNEQYEATLAWNLEATGLTSLNLERLLTERIEVTVETTRGEPLTGTLLKFEASAAGHELYVESQDHRIHVIPYHAVVRISVDRNDAQDRQDTPTL
jgi:CRP-like cAMP-binding protein